MEIPSRSRILASVFLASALGVLSAADARAQQSPAPVPPEANPQLHPHMRVQVTTNKPSTLLEERVFVEESDGDVLMLPAHNKTERWEQVCLAPCLVDLDRYAAYRVGDLRGVPRSHMFTLPQDAEALTLQVQAGDRFWHHFGQSLIGTGIAAIVVGASLIAAEHLFSSEEDARNAGFITGGIGIAFLAAGIPITLSTATHVYTNGQKIALTPNGFVF